ncbi:MAG: Hsp20/alpha crystallin family protein [Chloroflexi bacterium]|nr:Hsp20/alpha crystallin family protein [Chloroflexota bacterium]
MTRKSKDEKAGKGTEDEGSSDILGGTLNILGLKLDLGELLSSSEGLEQQLGELREKLKKAGGKEALSDEEWRGKGVSVGGYIRTRGVLGDREFHIGTAGGTEKKTGERRTPEPEVLEPPVDVFDEAKQVTIVADVPGVGLEDLDLKLENNVFSLATKPGTRRSFKKELRLDGELESASMKATCRNGVLEVRISRIQGLAREKR